MTSGATRAGNDERFHAAVETMIDCFGIYRAVRDPHGQIVDFLVEYVNEAACRSNQLSRAEQVGRGLCELLPGHRETGLFAEYCRVVETQIPFEQEMVVYTDLYGGQVLQRAFDIRVTPLDDGFASAWRDVTDRKVAEERLRFLADIGAALATSLDLEETLQTATRMAIPTIADACAIHSFAPDGNLLLRAVAAADPDIKAAMREQLSVLAPEQHTMAPIHAVLQTLRPYLMTAPPEAIDAAERQITERFGLRSAIVLPLITRQRLLGLMSLGIVAPGRQYQEDDLPFAEEVARRITLAMEQALLYEELHASRRRADESAALLNTLVMHAPVGFAVHDTDLRYLLINERLAAVNGLPAEAHLGRMLSEILPDLAPTVESLIRQVLATGEPVLDYEFVAAPGPAPAQLRHWRVNYYPVREGDGTLLGVGAIVLDVTAQRQAEGRARLLDAASRALAASLDYGATLATVADLAVPAIADVCLVYLIDDQGGFNDVGLACADPARAALVRMMLDCYPPDPQHSLGLAEVLHSGTALLQPELPPDFAEHAGRDAQHCELIRRIGPRAFLTAPLRVGDQMLGLLQLVLTEPGRTYEAADVQLVEELAHRCAQAIERSRLYEAEQTARAQAEQAAARTAQLLALAEGLSQSLTPAQAAQLVLAESVGALGAFAGGLFLLNDDQRSVELVASVGYPPPTASQWQHIPVDAPLPITDALRTRESVWIPVLDAAAGRYPDFVAAVRPFTGAVAVIPLIADGQVLGGLGLSFALPRPFAAHDHAFAHSLAQQCAQVLARAQLDAALRELNATLEHRVEERTTELMRLNRALEEEARERQRAFTALHEREAQMRLMLHQIPCLLWITDRSLRITSLLGTPHGLMPLAPKDVMGLTIVEVLTRWLHAAGRSEAVVAHQRALAGSSAHYMLMISARALEVRVEPLRSEGGAIIGCIALATDITQRQRDAETLQTANVQLSALTAQLTRSRDLLQTLFDGLADGLLLLDHSGTVRAANQALASLLNLPLDGLLQQPWARICASLNPTCPAAWVLDSLRAGRAEQRRERYTPVGGHPRVLDIAALPLPASGELPPQLIIHIEDSTERLQFETMAFQSERYIASGTMAAMVAHEVNTPLQAVKNFLFLLADAAPEERGHFLTLAREELRRIGDIVGHLLDLYRPLTGEPAPVEINTLVERVLLLTRVTCQRQQVAIVASLSPALPTLWGRADQLIQLMLNLVVNALEAMPEGGTLTITSALEPGLAGAAHHPSAVEPGSAIIVTVSDTGEGIPSAIVPDIFEPFLTNKPNGTGLGLAICRTIASRHGGTVTASSRPGAGASFMVRLPVAASTTGWQSGG